MWLSVTLWMRLYLEDWCFHIAYRIVTVPTAKQQEDSREVQWVVLGALIARALSLIPGQGTKIAQVAWHGQKSKQKTPQTKAMQQRQGRLHILSQFSSVTQSCPTLWTSAHWASLSITNSWSLLKLVSIMTVMPFNLLILCHPFLPPSIFLSIRIFYLFKWVSSSHQVAKVLEFQLQHQSSQWIFRTDFL